VRQRGRPHRPPGAAGLHDVHQHLGGSALDAGEQCGNVPATPVTKMAWTALTAGSTPSEVRVTLPAKARDARDAERLSVKIAADESVPTGTDLTPSVIDAEGAIYSSKVSALNPLAVNRLPASTSTLLKKLVLQQVNVPTSALKDAGVDLSDVREVRFAAATRADATPAGAVYLSNTAFESSSVGTPVVKTEPAINVHAPTVAEGNAAGTADIAVYMDKKASSSVTGYVSALGPPPAVAASRWRRSRSPRAGRARPSRRRSSVNKLASTTNSTAIKTSVINTSGAVMGSTALGNLVVREDDGVTGSAVALPAAGVLGDACAELAASRTTGSLTVDDPTPAPGDAVTITASGYRVGEAVTVSLGTAVLGVATADGSGAVTLIATVPADASTGTATVTAVGSGSGCTSTGSLEVLTATATTLSMSPKIPGINEKVTLTASVTASVTGTDTAGSVEFFDGSTSRGTADVVGLTLTKGKSGIAVVLAADETVYGSPAKGSVAVANGDGGTVTPPTAARRSTCLWAARTRRRSLCRQVWGPDHTRSRRCSTAPTRWSPAASRRSPTR
jgi:hypothetical protein